MQSLKERKKIAPSQHILFFAILCININNQNRFLLVPCFRTSSWGNCSTTERQFSPRQILNVAPEKLKSYGKLISPGAIALNIYTHKLSAVQAAEHPFPQHHGQDMPTAQQGWALQILLNSGCAAYSSSCCIERNVSVAINKVQWSKR